MFKLNPLTAIDSYKLAHRAAYPEGTAEVYSNFTPRSVKHLNVDPKYKTDEIVWFGGQAVIKDMVDLWNEEFFFKEQFNPALSDYVKRVAPFAGSDYSVKHLQKLYELGYLPLEIKVLPEGSRVSVGVPVLTIRNTHPEFFWLTNYLETALSAEMWKMSTSATIADYYRKIIENWAEITGGNKDFIDFQAHDFSARGMSNMMDAAKSGAGHLLSFKGSDTISAVDYLAYHYDGDNTFVAASVPATEHSIQCAYADDYEYIKKLVTEIYPTGIVSVVSDGYDYWNVILNILPKLKDEILARPVNEFGMSKVVIRPDSGDPVRIICGYNYLTAVDVIDLENQCDVLYTNDKLHTADQVVKMTDGRFYKFEVEYYRDADGVRSVEIGEEIPEHIVMGSVQCLWDTFGGTVNNKGFATLDSHIGLIYGDSITLARAEEILKRLSARGFASDNIVFGVGSYTYQYNTRDTLGFAMKATNIVVNGKDMPLWKDPKTDDGTKRSAKGLLFVYAHVGTGKLTCQDQMTRRYERGGELKTIFLDGKMVNTKTLEEIRLKLKNG